MKEINYYLKDKENQPKTSVTLLMTDTGISRGVRICSPRDQFVKALGRERANMRALKALNNKKSFGKIRRPGLLIDQKFKFKCEFDPDLTEYELELLLLASARKV